MKTIDIKGENLCVKPETYHVDEDVVVNISKDIEGIDRDAIVLANKEINITVNFLGTQEEWKRNIKKGRCETWMEYPDYTMSYGGGGLPQRYSRDYAFIKNGKLPIFIHCSDGDIEYTGQDEYITYKNWRE